MKPNHAFMEALAQADIAVLRTIPKTDVHNHGILGTRRKNIEQWIRGPLAPPPRTFDTLDDMSTYARATFFPHIFSQEGIEFTLESAILDAMDDGVTYLEMSIDTNLLAQYPSPPEGLIAYIKGLQERHGRSIAFCPELGIARDRVFREIEPLVKETIESGVFSSIDLYGNELAQPPEIYASLYAEAKRAGMKLKAHAGEFGSAEVVRHTIDVLELDAVQHGIQAVESPEVMRWLARNEIPVNVCPTSNVVLTRIPDMQGHPIRVLFDYGVAVTINTDDLLIFDQSVSEEYLNLFQADVLSATELDEIRQRSLERVSALREEG